MEFSVYGTGSASFLRDLISEHVEERKQVFDSGDKRVHVALIETQQNKFPRIFNENPEIIYIYIYVINSYNTTEFSNLYYGYVEPPNFHITYRYLDVNISAKRSIDAIRKHLLIKLENIVDNPRLDQIYRQLSGVKMCDIDLLIADAQVSIPVYIKEAIRLCNVKDNHVIWNIVRQDGEKKAVAELGKLVAEIINNGNTNGYVPWNKLEKLTNPDLIKFVKIFNELVS